MDLCGKGTGECVCTDDTLLCARGVLVENVLACAVVEFVLACVSCEPHKISLCNEKWFNPGFVCRNIPTGFVRSGILKNLFLISLLDR